MKQDGLLQELQRLKRTKRLTPLQVALAIANHPQDRREPAAVHALCSESIPNQRRRGKPGAVSHAKELRVLADKVVPFIRTMAGHGEYNEVVGVSLVMRAGPDGAAEYLLPLTSERHTALAVGVHVNAWTELIDQRRAWVQSCPRCGRFYLAPPKQRFCSAACRLATKQERAKESPDRSEYMACLMWRRNYSTPRNDKQVAGWVERYREKRKEKGLPVSAQPLDKLLGR